MKNKKGSVSVIIPSFNEVKGIGGVVGGIVNVFKRAAASGQIDKYEILAIDDGSKDKTAAAALKAGAAVIKHPINRGYGHTLLTGIDTAQYNWILMIDGDGSYPPEEITKLLEQSNDFDMIIGARKGRLYWGNPLHSLVRQLYLLLAGFVAGERIPDANSGLRLFKKDVFINVMPFFCYGYSFSTTMTLSFLRSARFIAFIPTQYVARKGKSKVHFIRDVLRTLQIMLQIIIYYNPLKLAVTVFVLLSLAACLLANALWLSGKVLLAVFSGISLFGLACQCLLFGCLLDSIRMHLGKPGSRLKAPANK